MPVASAATRRHSNAATSRHPSAAATLPTSVQAPAHMSTQSAALENLMNAQEQITAIRAQQRELAEQAKQLKAAMPTLTPLEKVIARQTEEFSNVVPDNLRRRINARVKAGQDRETATNEVISFYLQLTNALLDAPAEPAATDAPDAATAATATSN